MINMTDTKIETKSFSCPIFNKNVEIEATVDFIYDLDCKMKCDS